MSRSSVAPKDHAKIRTQSINLPIGLTEVFLTAEFLKKSVSPLGSYPLPREPSTAP